MELFVGLGVIIFLIYYFLFRSKPPTPEITVTSHSSTVTDAENRIIRAEIRDELTPHLAAVNVLQSLARVDGTTSEAERNQIFSFLLRNGARLTVKRHRPLFYNYNSGEWYRAATTSEFKDFINQLDGKPEHYRKDIFHTGNAIVATGGEPKKREAEFLELLKNSINNKLTKNNN